MKSCISKSTKNHFKKEGQSQTLSSKSGDEQLTSKIEKDLLTEELLSKAEDEYRLQVEATNKCWNSFKELQDSSAVQEVQLAKSDYQRSIGKLHVCVQKISKFEKVKVDITSKQVQKFINQNYLDEASSKSFQDELTYLNLRQREMQYMKRQAYAHFRRRRQFVDSYLSRSQILEQESRLQQAQCMKQAYNIQIKRLWSIVRVYQELGKAIKKIFYEISQREESKDIKKIKNYVSVKMVESPDDRQSQRLF